MFLNIGTFEMILHCDSWATLVVPVSQNGMNPRSLLYLAWECIIRGGFPLATDSLSIYMLLMARRNSITVSEYMRAGNRAARVTELWVSAHALSDCEL